jgi:carbon-monoxide dehydrogenase medium subunit
MLATLLDARMTIAGSSGVREVSADEFFVTVFTTVLEYDEILVSVTLPRLPDSYRVRVEEFARRAGDFAIVGIMTAYRVDDGRIVDARIVAGGVADRALRLSAAEASLVGQPASAESFGRAADIARDEVEPAADLHGSTAYRQDLVRALTRRALERAAA